MWSLEKWNIKAAMGISVKVKDLPPNHGEVSMKPKIRIGVLGGGFGGLYPVFYLGIALRFNDLRSGSC